MRLIERRWPAAAIVALLAVLAVLAAAPAATATTLAGAPPPDTCLTDPAAAAGGCAYPTGSLPPGAFRRQLSQWAAAQGVAIAFSEASDGVGDLVSLTGSAPPELAVPPGLDIERVLWARGIAAPKGAVLRLLGQEGWRVGDRPGRWLGRSIDLVVLDLAGPAFVLASDTIAAWALGTTGDGPAVPATVSVVNNPVAGVQRYASFGDYAGRPYQAATDFASGRAGADGTPFYNAPADFGVWRDITQDVVAFLLPTRSVSEVFTVNTYWSEAEGLFDLAPGRVTRYLESVGAHAPLTCYDVVIEHIETHVASPFVIDGRETPPGSFPARLRLELGVAAPEGAAPTVDVDVRVDGRTYGFTGQPTETIPGGTLALLVPLAGDGRVELDRVAFSGDVENAWRGLDATLRSLPAQTAPVQVTSTPGLVWGAGVCDT